MWDFLPVNLNEIKQIEVIRGPASAVWGANALYGVVNVITKSPREMQGDERRRSASAAFERADGEDAGVALVRQRHPRAGGQRSLGVQASAGGYSQDPLARPTGLDSRAIGRRSATGRTAHVSAVHEQRHDAAEVRRARRLRLPGRPQAVVHRRRRRHRRHHAHRHRSVRHQQRHGDGLRQGELHAARASTPPFFTQHAERRRRQPARRATPHGQSDRVRLRHQDLRLRGVERPDVRRSGTSSATAATCASTRSISRSRRTPTTAPSSASTPRTRSSSPIMFRWSSAARVDRFDYLERLRVLAAHDVHDQAAARTRRSACRTTAPTARRRSSTTSST